MPFKNTRNSREDKSRDTRKSFPKQGSKNPSKPEKSRDPRDPGKRGGPYSPDKKQDPNKPARPNYKNNTKTAAADQEGHFRKPADDQYRKPKSDRYQKDDRYQKAKRRPVSKSGNPKSGADQDGLIRLNRYIANAGICSRRKADELIEAGLVSVNGEVVTTLGTKVDPAKDDIRYNGERLKREKMVYVLLNKPKDFITTTDDPQERRTVMDLVAKASRERIYPVGRLDRNTTGLLLLTNDGNLSEKLAHPRNRINKLYHAELDKNLSQGDLNKIVFGLELEDGFIKPDDISYVQGGSKREIGIQIHSGKNRIIRRIFEHLGYEVVKLDRVVYANLTKKDLPRGHWRYLDEKEIIQLKHLTKY